MRFIGRSNPRVHIADVTRVGAGKFPPSAAGWTTLPQTEWGREGVMGNPRADFVPIVDRAPLHLPDGHRVIALLVVNVEQKQFDTPAGSPLGPNAPKLPEVPVFSKFEYGLRVGIWRMLEVTQRLEIPTSMTLNGSVGDFYPRVLDACVEAGWDAVAHGYFQDGLNEEEDERPVIRQALDAIERQTGRRPLGWLGPGLHETFDTPDVLANEGVRYVLDWVNDDQPYPMKVKSGRLTSVPYSNEINDIPIYIRGNHSSPEIVQRTQDALTTLLADQPQTVRVLPIAVHPFIMGQPHRFPYFVKVLEHLKNQPGVVFMTATQIYEWYEGQVE
jgi:peptidoglycan/xylan/chitin deacetylase (PgdA/CDA1 family)